jgi:hypothetical protein
MLELLKRLAPAIVLVLAFSFGMYVGSVTKDNEWKEEIHNEYVTKNEARASTQREVDAVSKKYQEDYAALEGSTDGVIDGLSRDNKRLRANACAPGSARGSNGRCESYVSVELHESTVKSLVRITESADLKERALQDTIRKLQQKEK